MASDSLSSVGRALDVLFQLHAAAEPQGVTALARRLRLPKSSVHRLLRSLAARGLVEQDARGHYRTGFALVALGLGALQRDPVVEVARPLLERAAARLGETVFLCGARGGALVVLEKVEGTGFLRAAPRVGAPVPVHATAVGTLFLAHAPEVVVLGDEPYEAFSAATPRTLAELSPHVARARERGIAENRGGWIDGLWVIAAPVVVDGRLHAAVAAAAPESRMAALDPLRCGSVVRELAHAIERRLSGRPGDRPADRGDST